MTSNFGIIKEAGRLAKTKLSGKIETLDELSAKYEHCEKKLFTEISKVSDSVKLFTDLCNLFSDACYAFALIGKRRATLENSIKIKIPMRKEELSEAEKLAMLLGEKTDNDSQPDFKPFSHYGVHSDNIVQNALAPFAYSGRCMRALCASVVIGAYPGKSEVFENVQSILREFSPTSILIGDKNQTIFGHFAKPQKITYHIDRSPRMVVLSMTDRPREEFYKPFAKRLSEMLMSGTGELYDTGRLEEARRVVLELAVNLYFKTKERYLGRILHLINAVSDAADENGRLSETVFDSVVPPECEAFMAECGEVWGGNQKVQNIVFTAMSDNEGTIYKINPGIIPFFDYLKSLNAVNGIMSEYMSAVYAKLEKFKS